jgi:hypothetical protein
MVDIEIETQLFQYTTLIAQPFVVGTTLSSETLKLISDLAPIVTPSITLATALGAGLWGAIIYFRQQRELAKTRLFESRKPFLEMQLKLYSEAVQIAGKLVVSPYGSDDWNKAIFRFWELYWSELAMVEDRRVETAMEDLGEVIKAIANSNNRANNQKALEDATYILAHAIRDGIDLEWGVNAGFKKLQTASHRSP